MGNSVCCVQKRLEFTIDCFTDGPVVEAHGVTGNHFQSPSPVPSTTARPSSPRSCLREDDFAAEVAHLIATDRKQTLFEAAALIPVFHAVKSPEPDEAQHTATAVDRKTGVTRQLSSYRKPQGAGAQERLHSFVSSLQVLSANSEAIAKVFEVFEDYMNVHVLLEHCNGGTVYERILERQYFTEQESAVLVKHMLEALVPFHDNHLYHGSISPDSFRFLNNSPHAPLKLVDFGVDLKVHRWDAVESVGSGPDLQNPNCSQFFETCKLVFCAPEFAPPYQRKRRGPLALISDNQANGLSSRAGGHGNSQSPDGELGLLDGELLADVIDEHAEWFEQQQQDVAGGYHRKFEAGDIWSVGAIAFLLLCGYPPFFAPSRNAILGRIHRTEYSFDPPFWSKISEEAKNFVHSCIRESCWDRLSVHQALEHPWIQRLADTSPSGSMFSSFMLNLRRFYRTSLIEMYVANVLANKFQRQDIQDFLRRCREIDTCNTGFFTASDLKHVLSALGHGCIADAITSRFLRAFRHPGESYIDYIAMLDSIHLRQQRIFEEALWFHFQRVCQSGNSRGQAQIQNGMIHLDELHMLFSDPIIVGLVMREIPESAGAEEATVSQQLQASVRKQCAENGNASQIEFHDLSLLLRRVARSYPTLMQMPEPAPDASNPIEAVSL
jgi:serine/threonine protein kinase